MASGSAPASGDVDLLVVGSASFPRVVEATYAAQIQLDREINPKVWPPPSGHVSALKATLSCRNCWPSPASC